MPRFTFKKNERLCSRKAIDTLFARGRPIQVKNLKVIFRAVEEEQVAVCQVLFIVPKKNFRRAVDRNLLKRRLREAYRLHKAALYEKLVAQKKQLHAAFLYTSKEILEYTAIEAGVKNVLEGLARGMQNA